MLGKGDTTPTLALLASLSVASVPKGRAEGKDTDPTPNPSP